jgi:hypothetical protein
LPRSQHAHGHLPQWRVDAIIRVHVARDNQKRHAEEQRSVLALAQGKNAMTAETSTRQDLRDAAQTPVDPLAIK